MAKPDIDELGIFCCVCHRWNDGQLDLCGHCQERLVGDRPLTSGSVASWVEGQVEERRVLGIEVPAEDQELLHRWAASVPGTSWKLRWRTADSEHLAVNHPVTPVAEPIGDAARVPARTQELMAESGMDWTDAWHQAETELGVRPARRSKRPSSMKIAFWVLGGVVTTTVALFAIERLEPEWLVQDGGSLPLLLVLPPLVLMVTAAANSYRDGWFDSAAVGGGFVAGSAVACMVLVVGFNSQYYDVVLAAMLLAFGWGWLLSAVGIVGIAVGSLLRSLRTPVPSPLTRK
jgi:hypothetical protein